MPASGATKASPPTHLRKRAEFLAVRRGEKRRGKLFLMEVLDRGDGNVVSRIGYTVTKKVGNAVVRNRIRRRLREAVRVHAAADMTPGTDYVIVGRDNCLTAPFAEIEAEISNRMRVRR